MHKYFIYLLFICLLSGCSVVSKQYYYEPNVGHELVRGRAGYSKMIYSRLDIVDSTGKNIATLVTSNGVGVPELAGPLCFPVIPVGICPPFTKRLRQFTMDISVKTHPTQSMTWPIDGVRYKALSDSLSEKETTRGVDLDAAGCYMIINDSKRVPLRITAYFTGHAWAYDYSMSAPLAFRKLKTLTIVTGSSLLDDYLKNIVFTRKKRLTFSLLGPS